MNCLLFFHVILNLCIVDYTKSYYPHTTKALIYIANENYEKAIQEYEVAFSNVPYAYTDDYINAILCTIITKKHDKSFVWLDSLASRGMEIEQIKRHKNLWRLVVEDTLRWNIFEKKYSHSQHNVFNKLSYFDFISNNKDKIESMRERAISCESFFDDVMILLNKNGFPHERISNRTNKNGEVTKDIIAFACTKNASGFEAYQTYLLKLVCNGILSPNDYVYQMDFNLEPFFETYGSIVLLYEFDEKTNETKYFYPIRDEKNTDLINTRRKQLGLPTLEEERTIFIMLRKKGRKDRNIKWRFINTERSVSEAKLFKSMYKNLEMIKIE